MVSGRLPSIKPQGNANQMYVPVIKTSHDMSSLFAQARQPAPGRLGEEIDVEDLRSMLHNPHWLHNVEVLKQRQNAIKDDAAPRAGCQNRDAKAAYEEAHKNLMKIAAQVRHCRDTIAKCDAAIASTAPGGGGKKRIAID